MDHWDIAILALAAYVAVTALVRLMNSASDRLASRFREELQQEQARRKAEEKKAAKQPAAKSAPARKTTVA